MFSAALFVREQFVANRFEFFLDHLNSVLYHAQTKPPFAFEADR